MGLLVVITADNGMVSEKGQHIRATVAGDSLAEFRGSKPTATFVSGWEEPQIYQQVDRRLLIRGGSIAVSFEGDRRSHAGLLYLRGGRPRFGGDRVRNSVLP